MFITLTSAGTLTAIHTPKSTHPEGASLSYGPSHPNARPDSQLLPYVPLLIRRMPGEENDGGAEKHRTPSVGDYELVRRQFAVSSTHSRSSARTSRSGSRPSARHGTRARARSLGFSARGASCLSPRTQGHVADERRELQRHPGKSALHVLAVTHELGADVGGVGAARTLLQRGAELWAELVRAELSFVEDLRRWDVLALTTGGETMDGDDEAREEVMRRAIVVIHGNMADITWVMVTCFPRLCHLCAALATEAVLVVLSRLEGTPFPILQSRRTAVKRLGKGASGRTLTLAHARASLRSPGAQKSGLRSRLRCKRHNPVKHRPRFLLPHAVRRAWPWHCRCKMMSMPRSRLLVTCGGIQGGERFLQEYCKDQHASPE
jgi:hypothetical protein